MAQSQERPVLTPRGYTPMKAVRTGMEVLNSDGRATKVTNYKDSMQPAWKVVTSEGDSMEFSGDHPWAVYREGGTRSRTVTTQYMADHPDEDYILPTGNTSTYCHPDRTRNKVFDPVLLGSLLSETSPIKGSLTIAVKDPAEIQKQITVPPDYALATLEDFNHLRLVWEEETLAADSSYPWIKAAGLLTGDYDQFMIPQEYLSADMATRSDLVYALSGHPREFSEVSGAVVPFGENLPLEHPRMGKVLRLLMVSTQLYQKEITPRRIVHVEETGVPIQMRTISIKGANQKYFTDFFTPTLAEEL